MPAITLIGAGSVVFARQLTIDILSHPELADSVITVMDINAVRLATAEKMVRAIVEQVGGHAVVHATLDRRAALRGADYVLNMVQVGMHEATLRDFDIPRKYGVQQTIADTLGVGGVFRALRTIPVLIDMCHEMEELCPDAWLLNYTNPMAMLCMAVDRATEIRNVGLCHSVQGTAEQLARYIGASISDVTYRAAGINHMAWYLDYKHNGEDAYPRLFAAMDDPEIYATNKVRFEMMRRLGYFVTESSEHMSEYLPYFIKRPALIERFDIPIDEYIRRSEKNLDAFEQTRQKLERGEAFEMRVSHEYAASIIHAMETNIPWQFNGNVANRGLITNLPPRACVEVPCLVDANGVQPTVIGDLPPQLAALNRTNINVQDLAVEAALTGKREHIYHAVMLDPHTASVLTLDEIWAMCDDLIDAHGSLLPRFH